MAHQKDYMLSGLERELELYMGEEYETPQTGKTHSIAVINTVEKKVSVKFIINEVNKSGKIITSPFTYTTTSGLITKTTKTHNVPEAIQEIVSLKKKGDTIITGIVPALLQYNEEYDPAKAQSEENKQFKVVRNNVAMRFEIDESKKVLKASAYIIKWNTYEYKVQEPVATQIQESKTFIGGLQLET